MTHRFIDATGNRFDPHTDVVYTQTDLKGFAADLEEPSAVNKTQRRFDSANFHPEGLDDSVKNVQS